MRKPRTPSHPPILRGTNSEYWTSKDGSAPRTLCFMRFEDGGKTSSVCGGRFPRKTCALVGRFGQQIYLVATDDYELASNKGYGE
jgi:hypothetical protein